MALWFKAWRDANASGEQWCCPVDALLVGATVIESLKLGVSRGLLLAVCLGFGTCVVCACLPHSGCACRSAAGTRVMSLRRRRSTAPQKA